MQNVAIIFLLVEINKGKLISLDYILFGEEFSFLRTITKRLRGANYIPDRE